MLKNTVYISVIVLNLLLYSFATAADSNDTKPNSKSDSEPSGKSTIESKKEKERLAAPLSEQESARTHNSWRPSFSSGHGPRILPFQYGQPSHHPINRLPIISQMPLLKPIFSHFRPPPIAPVEHVPQFKPTPPIFPPVYSPPAISKPTLPFVNKPTFVVSQQVIHKPVVTEKIEIIRRPVISEVVEVVHKPILSEVQQVIKHPTYIEHVVKKPVVNSIKNEVQGSPLHLPSQHYEVHDKPQHVQPYTSEVIQIPHQQVPAHGKPSFGIGSIKPSFGIGSVGLFKPSFGIESTYKPNYSGYKPSYGVGPSLPGVTGVIGVGSSQGFGSGYGPISGVESSYGPNYGTISGYGDDYGGVEQTYVEPAVGCKSGECEPLTGENAMYPMYENLQSMNSYPWYNLPSHLESRDLYERNSEDELYEQGLPLPPLGYYYIAPQMLPNEQISAEEQQASKLNDFLTKNPSVKPALDEIFRKFLEVDNSRSDTEKLMTSELKGRSNNEDVRTDTVEDKAKPATELSDEEQVNRVMDVIKSASGSTLKKIEDKVKDRETELANYITKSRVEAPSSESTPKVNST